MTDLVVRSGPDESFLVRARARFENGLLVEVCPAEPEHPPIELMT